jgi:hypothetical protein
MLTYFAEQEIKYTGAELRRGWLRATFGLEGDAIAAFIGPCDIAPEHMVDLDDLAAEAKIYSRRMLHFIAEHGDPDLARAVLRQRLLVATAGERIQRMIADPARAAERPQRGTGANRREDAAPTLCTELERRGNDLFLRGRKLSISVATTSPASALIHLGLNVVAAGAPVAAADLAEMGIEPRALALELMSRYAAEMASVAAAQRKVRRVP